MNGKISLTLAAAVLVAACGGNAPAPPPPQKKPAAPPATTAAAPAGPSMAMAAVADGEFGVKECDDYIRKYLACVDSKVPEAARAMVRQSLDQAKAQWKQAAATPQGKASLASGCKMATDSARQSMAAYGCQW
jgi:hypothetical protein